MAANCYVLRGERSQIVAVQVAQGPVDAQNTPARRQVKSHLGQRHPSREVFTLGMYNTGRTYARRPKGPTWPGLCQESPPITGLPTLATAQEGHNHFAQHSFQ
ncbi:hypothetical protein Bbelb_254720 [Branchiostoma belcheri]|nr:hypothetical protein Bbelb_254720 [Branchiostoma belcheri]